MPWGKPVKLKELIKYDLRRNFCTNAFPPNLMYYLLLADFWLGTLVINPLAISVVRGSWQNLDQLMEALLPVKVYPRAAAYLCFGLGCVTHFSVHLSNHYFDRRVCPDLSGKWCSLRELRFALISRLFTLAALYGAICNQRRHLVTANLILTL